MSTPIDLVGPPDDLEALIPLSQPPKKARLVIGGSWNDEWPAEIEMIDDGLALVRVSLPELTPPGRHKGELHLDRDVKNAAVEIEPSPAAIVVPGHVVAQIDPGERTQHRFTIVNRGNVTLLIRRRQAFGLMEEDGVESALSTAYRSSVRGLERLAVCIDDLAARHALARVRLEAAVQLAPGEMCVAAAEIRWPNTLLAARVYGGTWPIGGQRIGVRVYVSGSAPDQETEDA